MLQFAAETGLCSLLVASIPILDITLSLKGSALKMGASRSKPLAINSRCALTLNGSCSALGKT